MSRINYYSNNSGIENFRPKDLREQTPGSPSSINYTRSTSNRSSRRNSHRKKKTPLTIMNIDVGESIPGRIKIYRDTNPEKKAKEFIKTYNLPKEMSGTIAELIKRNKFKGEKKRERRDSRDLVIRNEDRQSFRDRFRQYSTPRSSSRSSKNNNSEDFKKFTFQQDDTKSRQRLNYSRSIPDENIAVKPPLASRGLINNPNYLLRNHQRDYYDKQTENIDNFSSGGTNSKIFLNEAKGFKIKRDHPITFSSNLKFVNRTQNKLQEASIVRKKSSKNIFGSSYYTKKKDNDLRKFRDISAIQGNPLLKNDSQTGEYYQTYGGSYQDSDEQFNIIPQFDSFNFERKNPNKIVQRVPPKRKENKIHTANFGSGGENYIDSQVHMSLRANNNLENNSSSVFDQLPRFAGGEFEEGNNQSLMKKSGNYENPFFAKEKNSTDFREYGSNHGKLNRSLPRGSQVYQEEPKPEQRRRHSARRMSQPGNRKFRFKIQDRRHSKGYGTLRSNSLSSGARKRDRTTSFQNNSSNSGIQRISRSSNNSNMNNIMFDSIPRQSKNFENSSKNRTLKKPPIFQRKQNPRQNIDKRDFNYLSKKVFSMLDYEKRGTVRSYDVYLCDFTSEQKDFLHQILSSVDTEQNFSNLDFQTFQNLIVKTGNIGELERLFG